MTQSYIEFLREHLSLIWKKWVVIFVCYIADVHIFNDKFYHGVSKRFFWKHERYYRPLDAVNLACACRLWRLLVLDARGLPGAPCPDNRCDKTVKYGIYDLLLCPSCENTRDTEQRSGFEPAPKDSKKPVKQSNELVNVAQASVASNSSSSISSGVSVQ